MDLACLGCKRRSSVQQLIGHALLMMSVGQFSVLGRTQHFSVVKHVCH